MSEYFVHSKPRLCEHCRKVETVMDFCSKECADAHYKAISNLIDGTTIREYKERIAALETYWDEAVRAEREACALLADEHKSYWGRNIAAAIRSRGQGREQP